MELVPWLSFLNFRGYWEWSGSGLHLPPRPKGGLVDTLLYQRKLPVCNILKYRKVLVEPDVPRLGRKPGVSPAETLNVESAEITPFLSSPDNFTLIPLSAVHQGLRDCAEKRQLPDVPETWRGSVSQPAALRCQPASMWGTSTTQHWPRDPPDLWEAAAR